MTEKLRALMSVAMAIGFLLSCTEDFSYQSSYKEQNETELLLIAKAMVQNHGKTVRLPINQVGNTESRSALSFIAEAIPLWDNVKYDNINGMQVLMVNLQTPEEILSRVSVTKNGETEIQESTTFSRLVIRKKGTKVYMHVVTYMPENNYATANKERIDTIGYYPYYIDFTGITLTSHLDGTIFRGIRYKDGKMVGLITKEKLNVCSHEHYEGETCSHEHSSDKYNIVSINLFAQSGLQPMSRAGGSCDVCFRDYNASTGLCDFCDYWDCPQCFNHTLPKNGGICMVCGYYEYGICPYCHIPYSVCGHDYDSFCPICGGLNGMCDCTETCPSCGRTSCDCDNEGCDICGESPCVCPEPLPTPEPDPLPIDTCDNCNQHPCICCTNCGEVNCICVVNMTPIVYVPHENDNIRGESYDCISGMCSMAVLSMAYRAYGEEKTEEELCLYYTELTGMSPDESTVLETNSLFMRNQFSMGTTTSFAETASGNVIIIRKNNHYVLVLGIQYDGDLIYADPDSGGTYVVNESYFSGCDNIVIYGINGAKSLADENDFAIN